MAITDQAPYAPAAGVITVLERFRETSLGGSRVTTDLVMRLSMGEEVARRVVLSLRLLDLIDDEGQPTNNFVAFKQASSDEYQQVLRDQLYDAYAPVFAVLGKDLQTKTPAQVEDAFRKFRPDSLRKRMVTCFLGLCEYAGIVAQAPKGTPGPKRGASAPRRNTTGVRKATQGPAETLPPKPPSPVTPPRPVDDAKARYVNFLLAKLETQDTPEPELLDRIERALGIANVEEVSTS
jgi:hypothetical protein